MPTLFRYKKWDGTQLDQSIETAECFDEFSKYLMEGWTPDESYEWILKQGIGDRDSGILGIDDLRAELSDYKNSLYETYTLDHALDEIERTLNTIIKEESQHLRSEIENGNSGLLKDLGYLDKLPKKISASVESLEGYDFKNPLAKELFSELVQKLEEIRDVEKFINRNSSKFTGDQALGFTEVLEIMSAISDLERIEKKMMSGDFGDINESELKEILSERGFDSILVLKNFRSILEGGGLIRSIGERTELTPKGIRKIGEKTLGDIFSALKRQKLSEHESGLRGPGNSKHEDSKQYEYGDPFDLNIVGTLKNSLSRDTGSQASKAINLEPDDFQVYESEYKTHASTVLLLDLSWSMSFQGRFPAAKRVALALDHLIKTRYTRDDFYIIGFSTGARKLSTKELAVTTWDSNDPFTNIQDALATAEKTLSKHKNTNKQIILITDGQPTAYKTDGYLQVELPMFFGGLSPKATFETLRQVKRVTAAGIRINTFMLDDSPSLRRFVDEMTRINKGRAFFTKPDELGKYLLVDYLKRRKQLL